MSEDRLEPDVDQHSAGADPRSPDEAARRRAREPRPMLERIGLALVALVLALMFGGVALASWLGGEPFLAIMGGIGCLMTAWVGALTLLRG